MTFAAGVRQKLAARLQQGGFLRQVGVLTGGTIIGQLITMVTVPILTRLYTPADLGLLGVFSAFTLTAAMIAAARYDVAIVSAHNDGDAAVLTSASIVATVPLTLIICGISALLIRAGWIEFDYRVIPLIGAAVFVTAVFTALRYWFIRAQIFDTVAKVTVYQTVARSSAQVGLGLLRLGSFGLIGGDVIGRLAGIGRMAGPAFRNVREKSGSFFPWPAIARVMREYREYPALNMPSTLLDTASLNLTIPLLAYFFGASAAGQFTLVQRLLTLPIGLITMSVADAFHARAAEYVRTDPKQLRPFYLRTAAMIFGGALVPLVLIAVLAPLTFTFIFGKQWTAAGELVAVMVPAALAQLTVSPLTRLILVLRRGLRVKLFIDVLNMAMVVGVIVGGGRAHWTLMTTAALYSASLVLCYVVYFAVMLRLAEQAETAV